MSGRLPVVDGHSHPSPLAPDQHGILDAGGSLLCARKADCVTRAFVSPALACDRVRTMLAQERHLRTSFCDEGDWCAWAGAYSLAGPPGASEAQNTAIVDCLVGSCSPPNAHLDGQGPNQDAFRDHSSGDG